MNSNITISKKAIITIIIFVVLSLVINLFLLIPIFGLIDVPYRYIIEDNNLTII